MTTWMELAGVLFCELVKEQMPGWSHTSGNAEIQCKTVDKDQCKQAIDHKTKMVNFVKWGQNICILLKYFYVYNKNKNIKNWVYCQFF